MKTTVTVSKPYEAWSTLEKFDAITAGFGVRNFENLQQGLTQK